MFLLTETYLRDNRIFFHLWLLLWADSWNNLWTFSTIWYCIFFCLKKGAISLKSAHAVVITLTGSPLFRTDKILQFFSKNSTVFSQRIQGVSLFLKWLPSYFELKSATLKEFHLNKNLLFLQDTEGRPPFQFLPYSCKFEGVALCQSLDRKQKIWGLPFF